MTESSEDVVLKNFYVCCLASAVKVELSSKAIPAPETIARVSCVAFLINVELTKSMGESIENKIGFGCVKLSACRSESQAIRTLTAAFDGGVRWFDTAPLYGQGYSEIILGKFLRRLSATDRLEVSIATKFGLGPLQTPTIPSFLALPINHLRRKVNSRSSSKEATTGAPNFQPIAYRAISKKSVELQLYGSLERLGVERIGAYLGHECLPSFIEPDVTMLLQRLKREGKIQRLGIGVSAQDLWHARGEDFSSFELLQYNADNIDLTRDLMNHFPEAEHVHHSLLKTALSRGRSPSATITEHIRLNPSCRILFASARPNNIYNNIDAVR